VDFLPEPAQALIGPPAMPPSFRDRSRESRSEGKVRARTRSPGVRPRPSRRRATRRRGSQACKGHARTAEAPPPAPPFVPYPKLSIRMDPHDPVHPGSVAVAQVRPILPVVSLDWTTMVNRSQHNSAALSRVVYAPKRAGRRSQRLDSAANESMGRPGAAQHLTFGRNILAQSGPIAKFGRILRFRRG